MTTPGPMTDLEALKRKLAEPDFDDPLDDLFGGTPA